MTQNQITTENESPEREYPQTMLQLLRSVAVVAATSFGIGGILGFANGLLTGRTEVSFIGVLMLVGALVAGSTCLLSGPMARHEVEAAPVPVSELGLTQRDFVLLQLASIEHANRLIADANTEDDDFGIDTPLALQFREDAARLLAMHHEFADRADAGNAYAR
ncbi:MULTISPECIES: hypothetical protein [unclassified Leucobacter]|uniref:hypothetical protein n=1 Tax=unclassified Leucobacter TaxID=2621730 RepID=UPI00301865C8